jgi:hypothetical protein
MQGQGTFLNNLMNGPPRPNRDNQLEAISNIRLNNYGPAGMKEFRRQCEGLIDIEEELSTPYIVMVSDRDRTIYE